MTFKTGSPRSIIGIILIALVLGPAALMLWMGKGRIAALYLLAGLATAFSFCAAAASGLLPMRFFTGIGPTAALLISLLPVTIAGLVHGLSLRRTALQRPFCSRWYVALPAVPLAGLAAALAVRALLFQPLSVPSGSMEPTLMPGDYFFASKTAYRLGPPQRGDIAVFRLPARGGIIYVKRVIGLPGERIGIEHGAPVIDGVPARQTRVEPGSPFDQGGTAELTCETLPGGRSFVVANTVAQSPGDSMAEVTIPAGFYFVMGDNRDNSVDSRFPELGLVPGASFIGPFSAIIWNSAGTDLAGRPRDGQGRAGCAEVGMGFLPPSRPVATASAMPTARMASASSGR